MSDFNQPNFEMQIPQAINSYEQLSKDVIIRYHQPAAIISQFLTSFMPHAMHWKGVSESESMLDQHDDYEYFCETN